MILIPTMLMLDRYLGAKLVDDTLARSTAALVLVAPMCIFLMPGQFYLVALPRCAFMVMLMLCARRGPGSCLREGLAGELNG